MALPIVETPRYELTLPSSDVKVQYRPFLVKEEKILFMALESGEENEMQTATKEILKSVTFNKIDVEQLPTFDVEYIFLQVRAKSVGEIAKFKIICPDDKTTYGDVEVDISKVEVQVDDKHTNDVVLDEKRKLGVVMKYPNMKVLYNTANIKALKYDDVMKLIIGCVDYIYEGEKNYPTKESTTEELINSGNSQELIKKIENLLKQAEFKRKQAPPLLKVSNQAFGSGWRLPIAAK